MAKFFKSLVTVRPRCRFWQSDWFETEALDARNASTHHQAVCCFNPYLLCLGNTHEYTFPVCLLVTAGSDNSDYCQCFGLRKNQHWFEAGSAQTRWQSGRYDQTCSGFHLAGPVEHGWPRQDCRRQGFAGGCSKEPKEIPVSCG